MAKQQGSVMKTEFGVPSIFIGGDTSGSLIAEIETVRARPIYTRRNCSLLFDFILRRSLLESLPTSHQKFGIVGYCGKR